MNLYLMYAWSKCLTEQIIDQSSEATVNVSSNGEDKTTKIFALVTFINID